MQPRARGRQGFLYQVHMTDCRQSQIGDRSEALPFLLNYYSWHSLGYHCLQL